MLSLIIAGALAIAAPQQQLDTTFAVRPNGRLDLDSYAGNVTIRSWNRNDVRVQATHTASSDVDVSYRGSSVTVEASPNSPPTRNSGVTFIISVPRSFALDLEGVNVGVSVDGIDANVTVETVNGGITIRNVNGRVNAESVSGQITVDGVRGDVTAAGSNNAMRLTNITGDIDAEAVNGAIIITNAVSTNIFAETVNGSVVLGTVLRDGGRYTASTTNGNIVLTVPEGANATIDISTFSGSVESKLPVTVERQRGGSYSVRTGNGSAKVDLEAFSGTIQLVRPGDLKTGSK